MIILTTTNIVGESSIDQQHNTHRPGQPPGHKIKRDVCARMIPAEEVGEQDGDAVPDDREGDLDTLSSH